MSVTVDLTKVFEWIGVIAVSGLIVVLFFYLKSTYTVKRRDDVSDETYGFDNPNDYEWYSEEQVNQLKVQQRDYNRD